MADTQRKVFEGTWEEIAKHAEELKGQRLRLVVLDSLAAGDPPSQEELRDRMLARLAAGASIPREPGILSTDPLEREFGEAVEEKHRKLGWKP